MTPSEISAALADRIEDVARELLGEPNAKHSKRAQWRYGSKGALSIELAGDKRGRWFSYELGIGGDALGLVQQVHGQRDALAWARRFLGIEDGDLPQPVRRPVAAAPQKDKRPFDSYLASIFNAATTPKGTLGQTYFKGRGCTVPDCRDVRFHRNLRGFPAIVSKVTDALTGRPITLHATLLRPDGSSKADVSPNKLFMPGYAKAGGCIRLVDDEDVEQGLGLAEGLETALSIMAAGWRPVWATCDAGNLAAFPVLSGITSLTVFADNDKSGTGQRAAEQVAQRWRAAGREARIVLPPQIGADWNDEVAA